MRIIKIAHGGGNPDLAPGEFSWEAEIGDGGVKINIIDENHECSEEDYEEIFKTVTDALGPMIKITGAGKGNEAWRQVGERIKEEPEKTPGTGISELERDFGVEEVQKAKEKVGESPFAAY